MINIIGGAGFVGTRLAKILNEKNVPFRIFDKSLPNHGYADVTKPTTLGMLPAANVLINLAAEHRDDVTPKSLYNRVNVEGAKNVCQYCRDKNITNVVFTSSVAVYGFAPEGTDESGAFNPFNEYGRTKMMAEAEYVKWHEEDPENRSLVIVRPTVIFGEQNRGNVYNLLRQIASKKFVMFGPGTNKKSMAYVQNICEFLVFTTSLGPGKHIFNYVDDPDMDMNTLVQQCRTQLFDKANVGPRLPGWLGIYVGYAFDLLSVLIKKNLPISSIRVKKFMSTTSFKTSAFKTGFSPSCSLKQGMHQTINYEFIEDHSDGPVFYTE